MPVPVHDLLPCMKISAERTDTLMKRIQDLLHRNVSPKKYSNGQAFRLQQVILLFILYINLYISFWFGVFQFFNAPLRHRMTLKQILKFFFFLFGKLFFKKNFTLNVLLSELYIYIYISVQSFKSIGFVAKIRLPTDVE